jgi:hypothetical protein
MYVYVKIGFHISDFPQSLLTLNFIVRALPCCAGWNEGSTVAEAPQEAGFPGEISNIQGSSKLSCAKVLTKC